MVFPEEGCIINEQMRDGRSLTAGVRSEHVLLVTKGVLNVSVIEDRKDGGGKRGKGDRKMEETGTGSERERGRQDEGKEIQEQKVSMTRVS